MARPYVGNRNGEQNFGNVNTMEVHDLDNENTSCRVDEIIGANHDRGYTTHQAAKNVGSDNGHCGVGGPAR